MLKVSFLTKPVELPDRITAGDYSQYGDFELTELSKNHPDIIFSVIKDEESFMYTNTFEGQRITYCKPWSLVETLINDTSLVATVFKDANNQIISYKNGTPCVIHNPEFNMAITIYGVQ